MTDMLVCRMLRGRPRIRDLSDRFDVPKSTLHDVLQAYRRLAMQERAGALDALAPAMVGAAIVQQSAREVRG